MATAIPWHRRLEARVLVGVTAIIGASLAALALVTGEVVSRHTISRAGADLAAAHTTFTHLVSTQSDLVATQSRLITNLPIFRAHMTDARLASDVATLESMAEMYRQELDAAFTIVSDRQGRWLASPGLPPRASRDRLDALIVATAAGQAQRDMLVLQNHLYLVVSEPATFADEVLGTLTTGYALDDARAVELSRSTGRDVVLVAGATISGSSLAASPRGPLAALLQSHRTPFAAPGSAGITTLGDARYVGASFPLSANAELILLDSWTPTATFIAEIHQALLWTGAIVFVLGLGASLLLARRMSRPLSQLAEMAGEITRGNWDQRLTAGGSAEAVAVSHAFNQMTTSLTHWREEARHRAEQLQAAYERFFAVTQSVHDAIVSTDADGAVIFWHHRAEALFGFTESDAVGRVFPSMLAPGCQERYAKAVAEITAMPEDAPHALTFDAEGIRQDGTAFPIELSLASWKSGAATCFTAVVRDVTERRRAEEALRLRDQQLREAQKMDAIGRLASGIAHDFNNSLMVIQGHAEMLQLALPEGDPRRRKVEVIIQSTTGASAITRRLLTFGRKQVSEMRAVDPREHVAGVQKVLGRLLGDDISVVCDIARDAGLFRIDPDQLDQVIMNLAINARDAMPRGGTLRFEVQKTTLADPEACRRLSLTPGEYVTIVVRDTGCGMDAHTAARIFEPFFTTKEAGRGTGLGLAIVADIVNSSEGRIEVDTAPGAGTTFRLHFPRLEAAAEPKPTALPEQTFTRGSETILIAEDKALVRRILRTALEKAGYTVVDAPDGEQALEVARQHAASIDLLLTDVVMPGRGGYELYEALLKVRPDIRVIFMTGHPPGASAREQIDRSGALCLQKPFSVELLLRELRGVLDAAVAA